LERFPILVVRGDFNSDGVVTLTDLAVLLRLALSFSRHIFRLQREGRPEMNMVRTGSVPVVDG
jgi:hypothetical protein